MTLPLSMFVAGADGASIVRALARALPPSAPEVARADYEDVEGAGWLDAVAGAAELASAEWETGDGPIELGYVAGQAVFVQLARPASRSAALELLGDAPWEVATFPSYAAVWAAEHDYTPPGFDGGHGSHGWGCAFKGAGHDRLVSRRWLPAGPWKLTEHGDVWFVEFHAPDDTPAQALELARSGHRRMGITDEGGYLQEAPLLAEGLRGVYDPDSKALKIVVNHRDVPQRELLAACQIRRERRGDRDEPVREVAYVFTERERAERHLRELWLRELACWAIDEGRELRLDGDEPPG